MKINLPFIGEVRTGGDAENEPFIKRIPTRAKALSDDILGGFLHFGGKRLSDEKTISSKLLEANEGWVYINNHVIAEEVSKMQFELYSVGLKSGEVVFNPINEHPMLDLLDKFNSSTTRNDGLYITQSHKKLTGDAFWHLDRNGDRIENIFILEPDKVDLDLGDPNDATDDLVDGYEYKDVINGKKVSVYYNKDEVLHFKKPNPRNPYRGYGVVEAAKEVIDIDNLSTYTQKQFFRNGAISNFVLTTEKKLTDDQLKRVRAEMRAAYTGVKNAYSTMILGGGLKPADISYSSKDMELIAQLQWYRDKIMIMFGNTKAALGMIDDVNRASHENAMLEWKRTTVKAEMDAIIATLNEFLVPMYGENLVLSYTNPIPEDKTQDINQAVQLYQANIISLNEAREKLDLDSVPNGGDINSDVTVEPVEESGVKIPRKLKHIDVHAILRKNKVFTRLAYNQKLKQAAMPIARKMINGKKVEVKQEAVEIIHAQFTNEQVNNYYEKQIHIVDVTEDRFEKAVQKLLNKLKEMVLDNLDVEISNKKFKPQVNKDLYSEEALHTQAQLDLTPILIQEAVAAGQEAYRLIGVDDTYLPYKYEKTIRKNVTKFTNSMLDTDREWMVTLINDGIKQGLSVPEIRNSLVSKFDDYSKMQAERVTRTEVLRTSIQAAEDAYKQSGVVEAKQWFTAGATDECAAYEGQIVGLGRNFYTDTDQFKDGDPPLHPNCRCVVLPIVEGTKAFQPVTIQEREIMQSRIKELEAVVDKRTKEYKAIKSQNTDDRAYIKALESYVGVGDD